MSANVASGPQVGQTRPLQLTPSSEPPKKKQRAAHLMPKLNVEDFTIGAIEDVIKIGRRTKERGPPKPGNETQALGSLLRKMAGWAKQVAPQYSLPEFMFASQAIGTNRSLRPVLANFRLAELREVNAEVGVKPGTERVETQSEEQAQTGAQMDGQIVADVPPDLESMAWNEDPNEGWEDDDALAAQLEMDTIIKETAEAPRELLGAENKHKCVNSVLRSSDSSKQLKASGEHEGYEAGTRDAISSQDNKESTRAEDPTKAQTETISNQNRHEAVSKVRTDNNAASIVDRPVIADEDDIAIQARGIEQAPSGTKQKLEERSAETPGRIEGSTTVERKSEISSDKTDVANSSATEN